MNRQRAAYHEAGHAVVRRHLGGAVKSASIRQDEESFGRVIATPPGEGFSPDIEIGGRTRRRIELEVMTKWAGTLAEEKYAGESDEAMVVGASADRDEIVGLASYVCGDAEETSAYIEWLRLRTAGTLRNPLVWAQVEALAARLLEAETLTAKKVRETLGGVLEQRVVQWRKRVGE